MVRGNIALKPKLTNVDQACLSLTETKRDELPTPIGTFFRMVPLALLNHIASKTTDNMNMKAAIGAVSEQQASKYYKTVTKDDILNLFAIYLSLQLRTDRETIKKEFHDPPLGFGEFPISLRRYYAIMASLSCEWDVFCFHVRSAWTTHITPQQTASLDETLYEYFANGDESDAPCRYYPNKPHKNGLLVFHLAFKTRCGPYLVDLEPDVHVQPMNPRTALLRIVRRWKWRRSHPLHVVHDAGFSREDMIPMIEDFQCAATCAYNKSCKPWLYQLLSLACPDNSWVAVMDKHGTLWSLSKLDSDIRFMATNAFKGMNQFTFFD